MEPSYTILYWHWLIFGMLLMMLELFVPSMTILWFGLGGLLVGAWLWVVPGAGFSLQLFVWALASCGFVLLWFKLLKPRMVHRTTAGISREAVLGEVGQVIQPAGDERLGRVRFTTPLLGEDEWYALYVRYLGERADRLSEIEVQTQITSWRLPKEWYPGEDAEERRFQWSVEVVRLEEDQPPKPISPEGQVRTFKWE